TDHQVKIRGMRVELGEIETVISTHPHVTDTTVAIRDVGSPRLVAYVTPAGGSPAYGTPAGGSPAHVTPVSGTSAAQAAAPQDELRQAVRAHAAERLPAHMVPSLVVVLDALPLNRNGKVDRARLPEADPDRDSVAGAFTPPSGPVQIRLAAIWSELLGQKEIGADDGLLALGGHSLLAMALVNRIRSEFGVDIGIRGVLSTATLAEQADLVTAKLTARLDELDADQLDALLGGKTSEATDREEDV
ncbi:phosphopantetheine-binding protein, partial [Streptomyces sp. NPDC046985]|uniref:phosphopantetheine-binding protein n=1 Tax=Streptomyces sp. NPDC046985 TaxID=3155377 RepID=UPI0033C6246E